MGYVFIIGIIVVIGYYLSLKAHPFTKCKVCNGTARHYGAVYQDAFRRCRKCDGTGRQDRLGVRLFLNR